jgi:CRP-like cAMP-binding protein
MVDPHLQNKIPRTLKDAEPECLEFFSKRATIKSLKQGEVFVQVGDLDTAGALVREGMLVIEGLYPEGGFTPIRFVGPGHGTIPTYTPDVPSTARIRALVTSSVLVIPGSAVLEACQTWPRFSVGFTTNFARRLVYAQQVQARIAQMPLEAQISLLLWSLQRSATPESLAIRCVPFRIPQQILGQYFGVPREEVNRKLRHLESQDLLRKHNKGWLLSPWLTELFLKYGIPIPVDQFMTLEPWAGVEEPALTE